MSNTSENIVELAKALLKAQMEMGDATKGAKNPFFKSSYADLNSVREASHPALNKNGIWVGQPVVQKDGKSFLQTKLVHAESGQWMTSDVEIVCAKPNDPQAMGSAISYARRYGLQSMLSIGAVDDDGEAGTGRSKQTQVVASQAPVKQSEAAKELAIPIETPTSQPTVKRSTFRKPVTTSSAFANSGLSNGVSNGASNDGWE